MEFIMKNELWWVEGLTGCAEVSHGRALAAVQCVTIPGVVITHVSEQTRCTGLKGQAGELIHGCNE
jgi:hypothetical protein